MRLFGRRACTALVMHPYALLSPIAVSCMDVQYLIYARACAPADAPWESLRDAQREELLKSWLLAVRGSSQLEGDVKNLIAGSLEDQTPLLGRLAIESGDSK